jgi:hypothetical protein
MAPEARAAKRCRWGQAFFLRFQERPPAVTVLMTNSPRRVSPADSSTSRGYRESNGLTPISPPIFSPFTENEFRRGVGGVRCRWGQAFFLRFHERTLAVTVLITNSPRRVSPADSSTSRGYRKSNDLTPLSPPIFNPFTENEFRAICRLLI